MAAEKGVEAAEKGATAAEKGAMGVEAADEEKGARAVEKGQAGVKAVDEEKGATAEGKTATAVEKGEEDSTAADEEQEGATEEGKGKKRETAAVEKEPTADWEVGWKWKVAATAAGGEEGPQPRRERRRWRSTRKDRGVAAEKEKKEEDAAAATEGGGEKTVFFFSAAAAGKMITLVSSEGQPFRVSEAAARLSVVLADMIDNGCAGGNIPLPNVDDRALATVIKYCDKHAAAEPGSNHGAADEGGGSSSSGGNTAASKKALDEWDRKLVEDLTQDALFDLITAANFLDIKGLLDASCQKVADMIVKKTPAQLRTMFRIANDFTAEEEEEIRKESPWVFDVEEDDEEGEV